MATVPIEWRTLLGGAALTGQCCVPIVTLTSYGPSAFAFTPAAVTGPSYPNQPAPIPAVPLLEYPSAHRTLGPWEAQNTNYGMTTMIGGFVVVEGTRSLLYFGRNGTGAACYGDPTSDQALAGTKAPDGAMVLLRSSRRGQRHARVSLYLPGVGVRSERSRSGKGR